MRPITFCFLLAAFTLIPTIATSTGNKQGAPKLLWEFPTGRELPQGVVADHQGRPFLYVANMTGGLRILDIAGNTPKQAAVLRKSRFGLLDVMNLAQKGDHLYLALGSFFNPRGNKAGLAIVNIKNPRAPKLVSLWTSPKKQRGSAFVLVKGSYAYLAAMEFGVMLFDVSNSANIRHLSTIQPYLDFPRKNPNRIQRPNARGLDLRGNLLFVAFDAGGLRVIDVSDKRKPKEIARYKNPAMLKKPQAYNNVLLHGPYAFIAVDYAGFEIVDIRNPRNMRQVGWWNPWKAHTLANIWLNSPGHTNQLAYDAKKKLVYFSAGDSELEIVDVSNPRKPKRAARYGRPKNKLAVWGMTMTRDRVYLAYITAFIPFRGAWAGIKALQR